MKMSIITKDIVDTVNMDINYPPVSERYFSHHYFVPKNPNKKTMIKSVDDLKVHLPVPNKVPDVDITTNDLEASLNKAHFYPNGEDTCVMMHSNRICVVCISERHPVIMENKKIIQVNYEVGGINRLSNKVSGKGKRGAQVLGLFSPLCKITCSDNSSYTIYAGTRGKLIEVNERLIENPNLICKSPKFEGYLAVVLPNLNESSILKDILLSPTEYEKIYSSELAKEIKEDIF